MSFARTGSIPLPITTDGPRSGSSDSGSSGTSASSASSLVTTRCRGLGSVVLTTATIENANGDAPLTRGSAIQRSHTSSYSKKSRPYLVSSTCPLSRATPRRISRSNPVVTASTVIKLAPDSAIPITDTAIAVGNTRSATDVSSNSAATPTTPTSHTMSLQTNSASVPPAVTNPEPHSSRTTARGGAPIRSVSRDATIRITWRRRPATPLLVAQAFDGSQLRRAQRGRDRGYERDEQRQRDHGQDL